MLSTTATLRDHRCTAWPARPATTPSAVPQPPAPMIAMRCIHQVQNAKCRVMNERQTVFNSSFRTLHSSFQFVLRAAQQATDVGPVHEDDQRAAAERDREQRREASRRRSRAPKHPNAERYTRGGRDRAERDVARAPDDEQKDEGDKTDCRRREQEKDAKPCRHALAAAKLEPDRKTVADDDRERSRRNPPVETEIIRQQTA